MKQIQLANGRGVAVVDDEDYDKVKDYRWRLLRAKHTGYASTTIRSKNIQMHRMLTGAAPADEVDHKDHDGLNNRRDNMRICDGRDNGGNRRSGNKWGYKGISYDSRGNRKRRWRAQIRLGNGKDKSLGYHLSAEDAAEAYDYAALSLFGEYAHTNFPPEYYL